MRFNIKAYTYTCALLGALAMFVLTWWMMLMNLQESQITLLSYLFMKGYSISVQGSFIGLFWGAVYGIIIGFVFSAVYNYLDR